jgi:hypothetical protein
MTVARVAGMWAPYLTMAEAIKPACHLGRETRDVDPSERDLADRLTDTTEIDLDAGLLIPLLCLLVTGEPTRTSTRGARWTP